MGSETEPGLPTTPVQTPWKSLHPASLAVNLVPQAWRTARRAWPIFLAIILGGQDIGVQAGDLTLILLFFGLTLARTLVHFLTLHYRLHDGRLEIKSGLIHRQTRTIDPKRIQNVELVRNLFHRATGLVELRVETA
ncbi:MAG: PH domain-containing protein, partial [Oligoflexia bacterium]|nr:PH domain-containing protein [Oligoflexia bacterium]